MLPEQEVETLLKVTEDARHKLDGKLKSKTEGVIQRAGLSSDVLFKLL